jgi:hypothetical protein
MEDRGAPQELGQPRIGIRNNKLDLGMPGQERAGTMERLDPVPEQKGFSRLVLLGRTSQPEVLDDPVGDVLGGHQNPNMIYGPFIGKTFASPAISCCIVLVFLGDEQQNFSDESSRMSDKNDLHQKLSRD